jgi:predicted MFS family arabinose efflux permease
MHASLPLNSSNSLRDQFPRYGIYLLLIVYTISFLDRQVINILAEPIKRDLHLSDTELGLLTGLSFAIFYTVLGIPIARLSEARNRSRIIVVCLLAWSGFTLLCGIARNLPWLILTRIGVGVGEAGCLPASHSMIAQYLPRERRAWAISVFQTGSPLGLLLGMAIGGIVAAHYGWRAAFFAAGLPGILLALIIWLLLPDPIRASREDADATVPRLSTAVGTLLRNSSYRWITVAASFATFATYAQNAFLASFFLRMHAHDLAGVTLAGGGVAFVGSALGLILGVGGIIGMMAGGILGDRLNTQNIRGYITVAAASCLLVAPMFLGVICVGSLWPALLLLIPTTVANTLWPGPTFAAVQSLVHERSRATAAALFLMFLTLFGLGLGPLIVGVVSDHLGPLVGQAQGLRWALAITAAMDLLAGVLFWIARRQSLSEPAA